MRFHNSVSGGKRSRVPRIACSLLRDSFLETSSVTCGFLAINVLVIHIPLGIPVDRRLIDRANILASLFPELRQPGSLAESRSAPSTTSRSDDASFSYHHAVQNRCWMHPNQAARFNCHPVQRHRVPHRNIVANNQVHTCLYHMQDRTVLNIRPRANFKTEFTSPRTTHNGQTLESSPITTSPIITDAGSMQADAAISGRSPDRTECLLAVARFRQLTFARSRFPYGRA